MDLILGSGKPANAAATGTDVIKDGSSATFMADVIEASRTTPVIVYFWGPRCSYCQQMGPLLEKVVRGARGAVRLVKLNVDHNQELAMQLRVQSVPMVYAFKAGRPVDAFAGALPESQLRTFVQRLTVGSRTLSVADIVKQGKDILAEGDAETAAQIFQEVLAEEPDNPAATAGLLRCLMAVGQTDSVRAMLAQLPPAMVQHAEVAAVVTALELADQAGKAGPAAELRRRIAADPGDLQARFDLALSYYATGEHEAAIEELLEVVKRDRSWNDDAARKQLIKFFEAFGPTHPLTVQGRRKLSSLLFS